MPLAARRRRRTVAAVGGAVVVAHGINRRVTGAATAATTGATAATTGATGATTAATASGTHLEGRSARPGRTPGWAVTAISSVSMRQVSWVKLGRKHLRCHTHELSRRCWAFSHG